MRKKTQKKRMEALNRLDCIDQDVDSLLRKTKAQNKTVAGNLAAVKRIHKNDYRKFSVGRRAAAADAKQCADAGKFGDGANLAEELRRT